MASQGPLVRVDTGRRHFIKMTPKDAAAWALAHPTPVAVAAAFAADVEAPPAPDVVPEAETDPKHMTVTQLRAYAEEHGIDLGDASKKHDILALIE